MPEASLYVLSPPGAMKTTRKFILQIVERAQKTAHQVDDGRWGACGQAGYGARGHQIAELPGIDVTQCPRVGVARICSRDSGAARLSSSLALDAQPARA